MGKFIYLPILLIPYHLINFLYNVISLKEWFSEVKDVEYFIVLLRMSILVFNTLIKFRGGLQWSMMESKDIISSICFKLKNENNQIVSFNDQISFLEYQSTKFKRWMHTII